MKSKYLPIGLTVISMGMANAVTLSDGVNLGTNNTVPAGSNSIAAGDSNQAMGNSAAIGYGNESNHNSVAVGESSSAMGWACFSGGALNAIDPNNYASFAGGEGHNIANTEGGVALGYFNSMNNQTGSAAIGVGNMMNFPIPKWGTANIILGENNLIDATAASAPNDLQGTVLIGAGNQSSSRMAFAFGLCNIAQSETVTLGTYAQTASGAALIVGNGSSSTGRSNGLVVLKDGEVQIAGSLVVGGSPTLTQGSASSFMQSQGFLQPSSLGSALNSATPPSSSAWSAAYVPRGNVSNGAHLAFGASSNASAAYATAIGDPAIASGEYSTARGPNTISSGSFSTATGATVTASGHYSTAVGGNTTASGQYSYARGWYSTANGGTSTAIGWYTSAKSRYETVFGSYNLESNQTSPVVVNGLDALFRLGNGDSIARSDAMTVLKNGQTTLTNRAWKADPATALAASNSNGEALVVEGNSRLMGNTQVMGNTQLTGNTQLMGKVTIAQPQGDISMGDYQ